MYQSQYHLGLDSSTSSFLLACKVLDSLLIFHHPFQCSRNIQKDSLFYRIFQKLMAHLNLFLNKVWNHSHQFLRRYSWLLYHYSMEYMQRLLQGFNARRIFLFDHRCLHLVFTLHFPLLFFHRLLHLFLHLFLFSQLSFLLPLITFSINFIILFCLLPHHRPLRTLHFQWAFLLHLF